MRPVENPAFLLLDFFCNFYYYVGPHAREFGPKFSAHCFCESECLKF